MSTKPKSSVRKVTMWRVFDAHGEPVGTCKTRRRARELQRDIDRAQARHDRYVKSLGRRKP